MLTNLLRQRLPYGNTYTEERVWAEYQNIYTHHPEWLSAIEKYFR